MQVFVSYAGADRALGEKLKAALQAHGIAVWSDNQIQPSQNWAERIEHAVRQADANVLLITPQNTPDQQQSRTWQAALEAVWSDDSKRLIPFLLGDAEPPAFARSTVPRDAELPVIRARDPQQDWEQAVNNLVALLRHDAAPNQIEHVAAWTAQDEEMHQQWNAEFSAYLDELKAVMPASPTEWRASKAQP
jgi:hypothetical protein